MAKILILDDDSRLIESVSAGLAAQGYTVETCAEGSEALDRLKFYHFDLAILDWSVPGMTGVQVCREFRNWGGKIPIIMLTGKNEVDDKEEAFMIGADDYLTKPFSFRELAARVRALLRRPPIVPDTEITLGPAVLNCGNKTVTIDGASLQIKPAEFALLELFVKSPNHAFTAAELISKLFASTAETSDEAVRQRVFRLRKVLDGTKLGVKNVIGVGYQLEIIE
jgi:DNA-binding response OmpR family regulator